MVICGGLLIMKPYMTQLCGVLIRKRDSEINIIGDCNHSPMLSCAVKY